MRRNWLFILLLVGCSSAPKPETGTASRDGSYELYQVDAGEDNSSSEKNGKSPSTKNAEAVPVNHASLREAVVSNNQRRVQEVASQLLARNPKDVKALSALGIQQLKSNKPAMARLLFKKALEVEPKNAGILNNYGVTFLAEKDESRAMMEFKKALDVDSDHPSASANIGYIHLKYRNYEQARRLLETAYEANRNNIKVANNFGIALRNSGDASAAKRVFEKALDKEPKDVNLLMNYALVLVENLKDKTKGQEIINKIKFLASDPAILSRARQLEAKIK